MASNVGVIGSLPLLRPLCHVSCPPAWRTPLETPWTQPFFIETCAKWSIRHSCFHDPAVRRLHPRHRPPEPEPWWRAGRGGAAGLRSDPARCRERRSTCHPGSPRRGGLGRADRVRERHLVAHRLGAKGGWRRRPATGGDPHRAAARAEDGGAGRVRRCAAPRSRAKLDPGSLCNRRRRRDAGLRVRRLGTARGRGRQLHDRHRKGDARRRPARTLRRGAAPEQPATLRPARRRPVARAAHGFRYRRQRRGHAGGPRCGRARSGRRLRPVERRADRPDLRGPLPRARDPAGGDERLCGRARAARRQDRPGQRPDPRPDRGGLARSAERVHDRLRHRAFSRGARSLRPRARRLFPVQHLEGEHPRLPRHDRSGFGRRLPCADHLPGPRHPRPPRPGPSAVGSPQDGRRHSTRRASGAGVRETTFRCRDSRAGTAF